MTLNALFGCLACAALAWFVGTALNVPVWHAWVPGDRTDMAVTAFAAAWFLLHASTERRS